MKYTFYDPETGKITCSAVLGDADTRDIVLANNSYVEGLYNETDCYISDGQAVAKPANPSTNDVVYYFDYVSKTYQLYCDLRSTNARIQRDELLSVIDRVNPVRWASLSVEQQQQLQTYRQALLDVPQQDSFPESIEWPAKPIWL